MKKKLEIYERGYALTEHPLVSVKMVSSQEELDNFVENELKLDPLFIDFGKLDFDKSMSREYVKQHTNFKSLTYILKLISLDDELNDINEAINKLTQKADAIIKEYT